MQGIGFRPFVYRLARQYQQSGWVANADDRVLIEIEGNSLQQAQFLTVLQQQVPGCGHISALQQTEIALQGESVFRLEQSFTVDSGKAVFACPDLAVCDACVAELFNPTNRRYLHPFISCCHCGPRYSLMYELPYDRDNTSLREFPLCPKCAAEYQNPLDRRFHAQTIACHDCGPQLQFYDAHGLLLQRKQAALSAAVTALQQGKIVAVKSVGAFQLLADATNSQAVQTLRQRKHRPSKPFAVMVSCLQQAEEFAELNHYEQTLLKSAAAPIVLVKKRRDFAALNTVYNLEQTAPRQALLGLMLPYTPLHHLLMQAVNAPLLATSGNQHGEPICIDNKQAIDKLAGIADFFLCHDRTILRPLDDSIVRVIAGKPTSLRRARGYVPTPVTLRQSLPASLAVGGHLKNTVAIAQQQQIILSQHLGDLTALETAQQLEKTVSDLTAFYHVKPQSVLCDLHPDYLSSQYAARLNLPMQTVQHHYAHILSGMAEHGLEPPVLGVAWDGTGLGTDHQLWGGEFLAVTQQGFHRIAHLKPFPLIGGFQAVKEPRRVALALLYGCFGEVLFTDSYRDLLTVFSATELKLLQSMLKKGVNCPLTSSIGRLFDGVASLLNLCHLSEFEGQAAMAVEQAAMFETAKESYPLHIAAEIDWKPLIAGMVADLAQLSPATIAAKFQQTLAKMLFAVVPLATQTLSTAVDFKNCPLVLSGGCFQNAYLVEQIEQLNCVHHYRLFRQQQIPPNDGGLALGQIFSQTIPGAPELYR